MSPFPRLRLRLGKPKMPLNRLLKNGTFSAEKVAVLNRAFRFALRELDLVDRADALTEIVAEKIIEAATISSGDPETIAKEAIKRLGLARNQRT
jgi:hypothetical protein